MRTSVVVLCVILLSVVTVSAEEKKEPSKEDVRLANVSIEIQRKTILVGKESTFDLVVSVKGEDVMRARVITTHKEKPLAVLIQTRGGGSCYYLLPMENVLTVSFPGFGLDLVRQGEDEKLYLDENRWLWRLKEGEARIRHIVGVGTLEWKENKWAFRELEGKKEERHWERTTLFVQ